MASFSQGTAAGSGPEAMNLAVENALSSLKPLRDLAQNWDIDIASCLEDYLHELVALGHPPDPRLPNGGLPTATNSDNNNNEGSSSEPPPNFAQAALLLQNSSGVYSRKVEYLHSLVYQALNDLIASTGSGASSKNGARKRGGASNDAILEELNEYDADMEFLLLNDVLPTDDSPDGDRINLRDDDGNINAAMGLLDDDDDDEGVGGGLNTPRTVGTAGPNGGILNATRLSLGGLSVTRLDRSAMAAGGRFSGGSSGGMNSDAATRALIGTILNEGSDGQGNLRLLSGKCDVSSTGALLMPGSSLLNAGNGRKSSSGSGLMNPDSSLFVAESSVAAAATGTNADGGIAPMETDEDGHFPSGGDDDDGFAGDDNDGVGFAFADDDDGEEKKTDDGAAPKRVQFAPIPVKKADPWALLDPHNAAGASTSCRARPLRIGVTYRLLPGVDITPSDCVTGARTKRAPPRSNSSRRSKANRRNLIQGLDSFVSVAAYKSSKALSAGGIMDDDSDAGEENSAEKLEALAEVASVPMTGLAYGNEFAYIAKATARREAASRREERRKRQMEESGIPLPPLPSDQNAASAAVYDDDDDDDFGGGFAFGGDDDDLDDENDGPPRGNVGVTSLDEAISTANASGAFGSGDAESINVEGDTFEELCRAHLRAFARGAEKYAAETQLSRRVGDWQSRLSPILDEEEQRPEFDIHVYGDRIMQTVIREVEDKMVDNSQKKLSANGSSSPTNVVDFHSVTKDSETYEVCRLFLSSLMLCNTNNLVLEENSTPSKLQIKLLQGEVERPMETYLAPSTQQEMMQQ